MNNPLEIQIRIKEDVIVNEINTNEKSSGKLVLNSNTNLNLNNNQIEEINNQVNLYEEMENSKRLKNSPYVERMNKKEEEINYFNNKENNEIKVNALNQITIPSKKNIGSTSYRAKITNLLANNQTNHTNFLFFEKECKEYSKFQLFKDFLSFTFCYLKSKNQFSVFRKHLNSLYSHSLSIETLLERHEESKLIKKNVKLINDYLTTKDEGQKKIFTTEIENNVVSPENIKKRISDLINNS